jgi:hypothetical protein
VWQSSVLCDRISVLCGRAFVVWQSSEGTPEKHIIELHACWLQAKPTGMNPKSIIKYQIFDAKRSAYRFQLDPEAT